MKKIINLHQNSLEYTLKFSRRARRMRLTIYHDGNLIVTAPHRMSEKTIEQFILEKSRWIIDKLAYFKNRPKPIFIKDRKKEYEEYRNQALIFVQKRIEYFNQFYGFRFKQIKIKNQKTRWGSCSKKGNLNFNYKIFLLPEKLADYVIVHELCHLKELNHAQKFWDLVVRTVPDYWQIKRELRKVGL
ncbi:MAG: SprT family zinc-dependent metalloprotease [Patescibacteria group bacterium]|jgi:hypothetical protein